jgi:radical SAM protein with 4Fe4S-binding SPASM domain
MGNILVRKYRQEYYSIIFNPQTGFFARIEDAGHPEPFWSSHGPELIDISLTNWCSKGCDFCYRQSSLAGRHMETKNYRIVMEQACKMGVLQVALGGGNPNQHPDFVDILQMTREEYGIVPSYTTNGTGLTSEVLVASRKYCGAVAVSGGEPYEKLPYHLSSLIDEGIRTNVHFVVDGRSVTTAIKWLQNPPQFLEGINAIVFLNYKPIGRGATTKELLKNSEEVVEFFKLASSGDQSFKIGFDSCMVSGLVQFTNVKHEFFQACEAGRFSMFVSEDMRMYPCSFMIQAFKGIPVTRHNMLNTWKSDTLFVLTRHRLKTNHCASCRNYGACLGGCPILPEINLCDQNGRIVTMEVGFDDSIRQAIGSNLEPEP